jgi:hypothetical protein
MTITGDGNVGIGTTSPAQKLVVNDGNIDVVNAGGGNITFVNPGVNAYQIKGGAELQFLANGGASETMRITGAGNVGIGTNNPTERLQVNGNIRAFSNPASGSSNINSETEFFVNDERFHILAKTNSESGFFTTFSVNHRGNTFVNGNLGVGTTSPLAKLVVVADSNYDNAGGLRIQSSSDTNRNLLFMGAGASDDASNIQAYKEGTSAGVRNLLLNALGGNVGIGTTSPTLQSGSGVVIYNATTQRLEFRNSTTGTANTDGAGIAVDTSILYIYNKENGATVFDTNNTERMRISSGGNVGIGNNNPLSLLHIGSGTTGVATPTALELDRSFRSSVGGNMSLKFYLFRDIANNESYGIGLNSEAGVEYHAGSNSGATTGTTNHSFYINNTERMKISANGDVTNSTGVYGTISDIRVKENIVQSKNYIEDLMKLRVVKYSLKEEKSTKPTKLGFIAQEVEKVFPNMVTTSKEGDIEDFKSIKTSVLIPMLVKAIQELKTELDELKAKVG